MLAQMKEGELKRHETWEQISEAGPIVFPDAVEHHGPGRHVHSHGKRLGGKQHLGEEGKMKDYYFKPYECQPLLADDPWRNRYIGLPVHHYLILHINK